MEHETILTCSNCGEIIDEEPVYTDDAGNTYCSDCWLYKETKTGYTNKPCPYCLDSEQIGSTLASTGLCYYHNLWFGKK